MCMPQESARDLMQISQNIVDEHECRERWLQVLTDSGDSNPLIVTRAEAERIFADRIAAHEARLAEIGWKRTVRVDSPTPSEVNAHKAP